VSRSRSRLLVGVVSGSVVLIAVVGIALAAKPKRGYDYATASIGGVNVDFTAVSGKKLTNFSAGLATHCNAPCGGFGGISFFPPKSIKVKNGKFKVSGTINGLAAGGKKGKKLGTETVTGKFVTATKVKGKVATHVTIGTGPHNYRGITKSYTAIGSPAVG
jgi:hypothetical protein